jgi:peptidoglycan/LPS O-acetylase OafA/YrhL
MATTDRREIKGLTSLRGIAASYVALLHFSATAQLHAVGPIPSLAPRGVLAVDLFFVLSGFIMAYTYLDGFRAKGLRAFPDFLARRFARIVPLNTAILLILALVATVCTLAFGSSPLPHVPLEGLGFNLVANLLFLQGIGIGRNLNGPSWSISDEVIAYLVFPLLIAMVFHRRVQVCIAAIVVAIGVLAAMASQQPHLGMDPTAHGLAWDVARCIAEFMLGLAIYRLHRAPGHERFLTTDVELLALALAIPLITFARLGDLFTVLLFPFLILAIARNTGRGQRILEWRPLYFLGMISYSLYLVHDPLRPLELQLVRTLHPEPLAKWAAVLFAAAGWLSVIPVAWLTYRLFERPGRTAFRRLLDVRGGSRLPVSAKAVDL